MSAKCPVCNAQMKVKHRDIHNTNILCCTSCEYEMQEHMPDDDVLIEIYNDSYYDSWGESKDVISQKERYFNYVLDYVELNPNSTVLEVGCATGIFLNVCQAKGHDAYGVDINQYGIDKAAETTPRDNLFCLPLEKLAIDQKFDAIFMFDYIEHVKNQDEIISIAYERLQENGILIITTPSPSSLSNKLMGAKWPHYIREHLSFFSKRALNISLGRNGFKHIAIRNFNKILSIDYLYSQVRLKAMPILPLISLIYMAVPKKLRGKVFPVYTGDIIAIAEK